MLQILKINLFSVRLEIVSSEILGIKNRKVDFKVRH